MARLPPSLALIALSWTGCQPPAPARVAPAVEPVRAERPAPAPTVAPSGSMLPAPVLALPDAQAPADAQAVPARADAATDGGEGAYALTGRGDLECALSVVDGSVRARCAAGSMPCATLARGRISRVDREDTVSLCEYQDDGALYVVVATERAVLWAEHVLGASPPLVADCTPSVRLLEAPDAPLRALLVSARGCFEPGRSLDVDHLYRVDDGLFITVASAQFECITAETRIAHDGRPQNYQCSGTYLVPAASGASVSVVGHAITVRQRTLGEARLMLDRGHVQRRFRWTEPSAP